MTKLLVALNVFLEFTVFTVYSFLISDNVHLQNVFSLYFHNDSLTCSVRALTLQKNSARSKCFGFQIVDGFGLNYFP